MKGLATFLTIVASCMTIFAVTVRMYWSKPRRSEVQDTANWGVTPPPEPRRDVPIWLRKLAKIWLYVIAIGLTVAVIVLVVVFFARIIALSQ